MDWPTIFSISNMVAMAGWLLLIVGPRKPRWARDVPGLVIPFAFGLTYAAFALPAFFGVEGGGYGSMGEVRALFGSDPMLVAGWQHYLAFDLLVGCWIAARLDAAGVGRLVQAPILVATFMFGPVGFVLGIVTEAVALRVFPARREDAA